MKYIVKIYQENIISKRNLPQYEINDAHSRWNYHRIWETGNKKNGQDEEDKLGGNFICLLALPEKLDTLFKNENELQKMTWFQFHFIGLLGTFLMSKQETIYFSMIGLWR